MQRRNNRLLAAGLPWLLLCGLLLRSSLAEGDVAPSRTSASFVPLLWPELPKTEPTSGTQPRIESAAAELDLYPTILSVQASLLFQSGDKGVQDLLVGVPETSSPLRQFGSALLFFSVFLDGKNVAVQSVHAHCSGEPPHPFDIPRPLPAEHDALCKQIAQMKERRERHESGSGFSITYRVSETWWLFRLTLPPKSKARIDLRYLQRLDSDEPNDAQVDSNRSVYVSYLVAPAWPVAHLGKTRVTLRLHGLGHADKKWQGPPATAKDGETFEWQLTPMPDTSVGIGLRLQGHLHGLPGREVEIAPYAQGAQPDVQIFDRVHRFYRDLRPPSRWQWYTLFSYLYKQARLDQDSTGRRMARSLLAILHYQGTLDPKESQDAQACLAWLGASDPNSPNSDDLQDGLDPHPPPWLEPARELSLPSWITKRPSPSILPGVSEGAKKACQVRKGVHWTAYLLPLMMLLAGALWIVYRHRNRRQN